jgi:DNA polymerase-4
MNTLLWSRAILHLDMDAFFVNVHLLHHPEQKGLPLAVGGTPAERGVVASASYEARQFGVRSAMPSSQAVKLCPALVFVRHNWEQIHTCSSQIMELLAHYGPVEQMSVDEAYVDLSQYPNPEQLALFLRQQVKREVGLPASVGLASSKLVAKVASDYDKPEGCTIVMPGEEARFLAPLPVRALHGIGPRTAERLAEMGLNRCGQLGQASLDELRLVFGRHGDELQQKALGIDPRPVVPESGPAKSISQEWTFNEDIGDEAQLAGKLAEMCELVAHQLQKKNLLAHTISVKFRLTDFTTFTRQKTVEVGVNQAADILRVAEAVWREFWPPGRPLRLLGVGVSNLEQPLAQQLPLPLDPKTRAK